MIALLQCPNCNEQRQLDTAEVPAWREVEFHAWVLEWLRKHGLCPRRARS